MPLLILSRIRLCLHRSTNVVFFSMRLLCLISPLLMVPPLTPVHGMEIGYTVDTTTTSNGSIHVILVLLAGIYGNIPSVEPSFTPRNTIFAFANPSVSGTLHSMITGNGGSILHPVNYIVTMTMVHGPAQPFAATLVFITCLMLRLAFVWTEYPFPSFAPLSTNHLALPPSCCNV